MNSKLTILFPISVVALCAFAAGYWLGTENTLTQLSSLTIDSPIHGNKPQQDNQAIANNIKSVPTITNNSNKQFISKNDLQENTVDPDTQDNLSEQPNRLVLPQGASVIEMLEFLAKLGLGENVGDVEQFAPTLDLLRAAVAANPDNMQLLIDYYIESDAASQAPYYFTSILQGTNIQDKDIILQNMVGRLTAQGTANANKKLLHLISSTSLHQGNEQIIDTIKNIALYSQVDQSNRMYALDLLMPYQLSKDEKSKVVNDLTFSLAQTPSEEVGYMVENIIRFSDKDKRTDLAANYLSDTNDFTTRIAILSTLHSGTIKPNDILKTKLFDIAQNPNDPLHKHATDTLMYVFEIDNNEYERLRNGG